MRKLFGTMQSLENQSSMGSGTSASASRHPLGTESTAQRTNISPPERAIGRSHNNCSLPLQREQHHDIEDSKVSADGPICRRDARDRLDAEPLGDQCEDESR